MNTVCSSISLSRTSHRIWKCVNNCENFVIASSYQFSLRFQSETIISLGLYNCHRNYIEIKYHFYSTSEHGFMGRNISVCLDGLEIESRWWAGFSAPVQTSPGAYSASCTMGTGSFPRVKRPGLGADYPSPPI